jgi:AcrR family transcriptional regulator
MLFRFTTRSIMSPRAQRADAQRNTAALLDAAKSAFATSGVDVPAKQITDLAGVGVGTLYRHYPRRSDLIVAVLQQEIDDCIDAASELGSTHGAWPAVTKWIERFRDFVDTKQGLAAALHSDDAAYDGLPERLLDQLAPALQSLLDRASASGDARGDLSAREVMTAVALLSQPAAGAHSNQRMIGVFVDGLGAR